MATSPLIPEQRVNKLGHVVTKHVKAAPATGSRTKTLPAPAAAPATDHLKEQRVNNLVASLDAHLLLSPGQVHKLRTKLSSYKNSTTYDLLDAAAQWNTEQLLPSGKFMFSLITLSTEQAVRETAYYRPRLGADLSNNQVHQLTHGMHLLDRYRDTRLEELTGQEQELATAYLAITATLDAHVPDDTLHDFYKNEPAVTIRDPKLIDLIATHCQQTHQIISYIEERSSAVPAALREYLDNATALKTGVL